MYDEASSATVEDPAIGLLTRAVTAAGGDIEIDSQDGLLTATLSSTRSLREVDKRRSAFQFTCRAAPTALERTQELLALALWRRVHGGQAHGLVIRLPRMPTQLERWSTMIDEMLAQGAVKRMEPATMPFAVCSERGGCLLRLPGLVADLPDATSFSAAPPPRKDLPQHDAALRALKILLAQAGDHSQRWWGGPQAKITTGLQLARLTGTSASSIYVLLDALAGRGWIRKGYAHELRLLDVPAALTWWLDQAKHQQRQLIPVRPLYAPARPLKTWAARCRWLREQAATRTNPLQPVGGSNPDTWAVSGWAACHLLDLGILQHPEEKPFTLTIDRSPVGMPGFLKEWQLVDCDPRDAVFRIEATGPTHRVPLAATLSADGLPVVDGWQAALDVASDPDRGIEQAQAIAERLWPQP